MGWLQNVQARRQQRQLFSRAGVVASPRTLSADELLGWESEADATSVHAAAEALRDATGGLLLDGSGFLVH